VNRRDGSDSRGPNGFVARAAGPEYAWTAPGVVRGGVAWLVGWLVTLGAGVVGLLSGVDGLSAAATTYLQAHTVPPSVDPGVLVVVLAVAVGGARAGHSTRSGVTGRFRSAIQSIRGTEMKRDRTAAVAGAFLAVGYAVVGVAVGRWLGTQAATALVGGVVYGLAVGVPASVAAAMY